MAAKYLINNDNNKTSRKNLIDKNSNKIGFVKSISNWTRNSFWIFSLLNYMFYLLIVSGQIDAATTTTTTTNTITTSSASENHKSTDRLIRDILLNQSTAYYDEMVLEQLLAAANMSRPSPETWRVIVELLTKEAQKSPPADNVSISSSSSDSISTNGKSESSSSSLPSSSSSSLIEMKNKNQKQKWDRNDANVTISKKSSQLVESAIDEFPPDFMSDQTRQNGGFVVHILIFIYLSIVLAVVCDNYFLKSLEHISEALHLPSDIAGATFMAIGTSAPELFTSVIGVFISDNDIGTGTIVGSAVFNLIAIPGACGFAAYYNLKNMPKINPFPIIRDTIFYVLTIITLILCIKDNKVDWIESITLIALYIVYIIIMYFNAQISHVVGNKQPYRRCSNQCSAVSSSTEDLEKPPPHHHKKRRKSQLTLDETEPLLLSDGSVRLSPPPAYQSNHCSNFNGPQKVTASEQQIDLSKIHLTLAENGKFKEIGGANAADRKLPMKKIGGRNSDVSDLEQSIDLDEIETDWSDNRIIQILLFPFRIIFFITLPKPTRFCFVVTFVCSIIWIACLTYFIVWMVTLVGYTLGIPDTVSGITVLAAGTSIPELISSYLIVKKAGLADMAICNSIGSNIFDILFCLGLPWLLKSSIVIMTNGFGLATLANSFIPIQSTALPITSLTLLLTIGAMIMIFKTSRWRLNLRLGILCLIVYVIFVITSTSLELNV